MKRIVISAGFIFAVLFAQAQAKSIINIKNKKVLFIHTVVAKETLTGIAKLYDISITELTKENGFDKNTTVKIGQKVKVAVPLSSIHQKRKTASPLYYTVDSKETLAQVGKKFNNVSVANLRSWNNIKSNDIDKDDKLIIGYLPGANIKDDDKKDAGKNIMSKKNTGEKKVKVNVENTLNIRKGPDAELGIVAIAQKDDVLTLVKQLNSEWSFVRTSDGTEGFVASQFLVPIDEKPAPVSKKEVEKGKEMKVIGTTLNIRKGPATNEPIIAKAAQEEKLVVLKNLNKDWAKVRLTDGTEGYAAVQFIGTLDAKIEIVKPANTEKQVKVIGSLLNIRNGASTQNEIIAQAKQEENVILIKEINKDWAAVRTADGKEGFAASLYLDLPGNKEKLLAQQTALAAAAAEQAKLDAVQDKKIVEEKTAIPDEKHNSDHYFEAQYKKGNHTKVAATSIFKTDIGWNDGGKYFILIDEASVGSIVKVTNPLNSKFIYAKVLGKMSGMDINNGFDIRISDAAAATLGIKNTDKFNVEINYL